MTPEQNGRHFAENFFKCVLLYKNNCFDSNFMVDSQSAWDQLWNLLVTDSPLTRQNWMVIYDFLVQDCSISIANPLETWQSFTKPFIWIRQFFIENSVSVTVHTGLPWPGKYNVALTLWNFTWRPNEEWTTLWNFTWRPNEEWTTQKLDDVGCISMQHAQTNWGWGLGKSRNTPKTS